MPSPTRNTNAYSGSDGSIPAKPKTTSKTTRLKPSDAAKESTTVAISSSGATTARSSRMRIRNTTVSAIGGIRMLSRAAAVRTSRSIADGPPTSTSSPPASFTATRSGSMMS